MRKLNSPELSSDEFIYPSFTLTTNMEGKTDKKKLDAQLLKRLRSGDEVIMLKALGDLRTSGHLDYIPEIFQILKNSDSETLHREIATFLSDIKDIRVIPLYIKGLKDPSLTSVQAVITSACWQSGMDYSEHMELFIIMFLESDYMTSLESFSVIEQSMENLSSEEANKYRERLLEDLKKISNEKKPLARELLSLLQT